MSFTSLFCYGRVLAAVSSGSISVFDLRQSSNCPKYKLDFDSNVPPLVVKNFQADTSAMLSLIVPASRKTNMKVVEQSFNVQTGRLSKTKVLPFKEIPKHYYRFSDSIICSDKKGFTLFKCVESGEKFCVVSKSSFDFHIVSVDVVDGVIVVVALDGILSVVEM
ncbi:hypothetical protein GEMRC1_011086 [Eukaryota sp. GEM-RC1]